MNASRPAHHPSLPLPSFQDFSSFQHLNGSANVEAGPSSRRTTHARERFMSDTYGAGTNGASHDPPPAMTSDPSFDILEWYPAYQSCQRYFLDHAQHEPGTQALCALINIRLPFQYLNHPITSSSPPAPSPSAQTAPNPQTYQFNFPAPGALPSPSRSTRNTTPTNPFISLVPYIRRLTITGFDKPPILHGFFGDDYTRGILPHLDCERRNYLFAAKHGGWRTCKKQYDGGSGMGGEDESVPFMKPLDEARGEELSAAEKAWSQWLAMEDWMVGPNAPREGSEDGGGDERNVEAVRTGRREEQGGVNGVEETEWER